MLRRSASAAWRLASTRVLPRARACAHCPSAAAASPCRPRPAAPMRECQPPGGGSQGGGMRIRRGGEPAARGVAVVRTRTAAALGRTVPASARLGSLRLRRLVALCPPALRLRLERAATGAACPPPARPTARAGGRHVCVCASVQSDPSPAVPAPRPCSTSGCRMCCHLARCWGPGLRGGVYSAEHAQRVQRQDYHVGG